MADNETENQTVEQTEEIQETQVGETQEVQTEETKKAEETEEKEPEPKESFIKRMGDKIKETLSGGSGDEEPGTEIPDEFTDAMRAKGYSDEDTSKFASSGNSGEPFTDEQLKEMIPSLLGEDSAKADKPSDKAGEETKPETKLEGSENSQEDDKLKPLLDRIAALETERDGRTEKSKEEEHASFNNRASELFDKISEEFEVFGKTDELPTFPHNGQVIPTSPQMKARLEVYGKALQLKEAGMPGDEALEFSLNAYKGANLTVETKRNVIKGLKKREQTLGGKRVSHETTGTGNLTGPQVLQAIARKHGVELPP